MSRRQAVQLSRPFREGLGLGITGGLDWRRADQDRAVVEQPVGLGKLEKRDDQDPGQDEDL